MNWNIEWMNRWFESDGRTVAFKPSSEVGGVNNLQGLATRAATVIQSLTPDVLLLQEGPSQRAELRLFVDNFLDGDFEILGPAGKGQQKLYALIKKGGAITQFTRVHEAYGIDFSDVYDVDIDGDLIPDEYRFTRPPLVFSALAPTSGGAEREILFMNLHTKSKYVHNGARLWRDPNRRQEFIKLAVKARRRISAEAMRVREFLNAYLEPDSGDDPNTFKERDVLVAGDFNDGPGLEFFERLYLTHNVAGLIAGSAYVPQTMLRHAFVDQVKKEDNYTAVFNDFVSGISNRKVLLDHIFVSPKLYWKADGSTAVEGSICHTEWAASEDTNEAPRSRGRFASDHRPQLAVIDLG